MDLFFGIDISSEKFDSFNEDSGRANCQNKLLGIAAYLKSLPKGAILALEATGGYGKLLADKAVKAGFTVYMLQPVKVKRFRQSGPDKGKTDRIDARVIHEYIRVYQSRLHPYEPLPKFEARLRKLARTRDGLVRKLASLRTQLRSLGDSPKAVKTTLVGLEKRVLELTTELECVLASAEDAKVLFTIPGVKTCTVAAVLPALRTIPFKDKYAFDSYAGIDLRPNESGKLKGRRKMSKEGDKHMRRAVFMAALSGTNAKVWKAHYEKHLGEKQLKKIQAINALARKILHTIYGVYKTQTAFAKPPGG
jgi:transposase